MLIMNTEKKKEIKNPKKAASFLSLNANRINFIGNGTWRMK